MDGYVLVGGWPASGKSTLARALALELGTAYLSKDELKEALMDSLGAPRTVPQSQGLGRAAVTAVLRVARGCPGAVVDSTWFPYTAPMVAALDGPVVEVRCQVARQVARDRYRLRRRDPRHLDEQQDEHELWAAPVAPLGAGPLLLVDTTGPTDVVGLALQVRQALGPDRASPPS